MGDLDAKEPRVCRVPDSFDLQASAAPVAWSRGRWPDVDWIDDSLIWVGREGEHVVHRSVRQLSSRSLAIAGTAQAADDQAWIESVFSTRLNLPVFTDPVLADLLDRFPGLYPHSAGSLFDGVINCIIGQSITVAAAATVQRRVSALCHPGIEIADRHYHPSPRAEELVEVPIADLRATGVTWRRAQAIHAAAEAELAGDLPSTVEARADIERARRKLLGLPLVGKWTCESALLWGVGSIDAFPTGDIALLRAVKQCYELPDATLKDLDTMSLKWKPAPGYAARLLWTALLGKAPIAKADHGTPQASGSR